MNDELQSANEELERSKEELQSMNEELAAVNNQLTDKLDELDAANADMANLLASTDIATIFLDHELRIRLFTPVTGKLLNLLAADVGRPITDFAGQPANEELVSDARRVLEKNVAVESEISTQSGRSYLRRVVPYRSDDGHIGGVVVNFIDITRRKQAEDSLREVNARLEARVEERSEDVREREERLRAVVATAADAIITVDKRGVIQSFNPAAERMFGYTLEEAQGENVSLLMSSPYKEEHDGYIARYLETGEPRIIGIGREVEARRKDGSTFPIDLAVSEIDHLDLFTGIIRDISERRRHETVLAESEARLRGLTARLLSVQEQERREISRELHDVIGQKLTLLRMQIDQLGATGPGASLADDATDKLREITDALAGHVRNLSYQLHPSAVEHLGLIVALRKECEMVAEASAKDIRFRAVGVVPRSPPLEVAMCLYRVAQEALHNAVKHSKASRIDVSLEVVDDGIELAVVDSGGGFHTDAERSGWGLGLVSMEERARVVDGRFEVQSTPGDGTSVRCWAPLPAEYELE